MLNSNRKKTTNSRFYFRVSIFQFCRLWSFRCRFKIDDITSWHRICTILFALVCASLRSVALTYSVSCVHKPKLDTFGRQSTSQFSRTTHDQRKYSFGKSSLNEPAIESFAKSILLPVDLTVVVTVFAMCRSSFYLHLKFIWIVEANGAKAINVADRIGGTEQSRPRACQLVDEWIHFIPFVTMTFSSFTLWLCGDDDLDTTSQMTKSRIVVKM